MGSVEATLGAHKEVQTLGDDSGRYPAASKPTASEAVGSSLHVGVCATCSSISPRADEWAISFLPLNHNGTFSSLFLVKWKLFFFF